MSGLESVRLLLKMWKLGSTVKAITRIMVAIIRDNTSRCHGDSTVTLRFQELFMLPMASRFQ